MTACFYPIKLNNMRSSSRKERFRFIEHINLLYNVEKSDIDDMMRKIISDNCNVSVIGYEKYYDKFWCKKYNRDSCDLHIEIQIIGKGRKSSIIKIIPLVGVNTDIVKFILTLDKQIRICESPKHLTSEFL